VAICWWSWRQRWSAGGCGGGSGGGPMVVAVAVCGGMQRNGGDSRDNGSYGFFFAFVCLVILKTHNKGL
jgi:hypothetical protein